MENISRQWKTHRSTRLHRCAIWIAQQCEDARDVSSSTLVRAVSGNRRWRESGSRHQASTSPHSLTPARRVEKSTSKRIIWKSRTKRHLLCKHYGCGWQKKSRILSIVRQQKKTRRLGFSHWFSSSSDFSSFCHCQLLIFLLWLFVPYSPNDKTGTFFLDLILRNFLHSGAFSCILLLPLAALSGGGLEHVCEMLTCK